MNETVTIPKAEYDRLCALEEELADMQATLAVEQGLPVARKNSFPPPWMT